MGCKTHGNTRHEHLLDMDHVESLIRPLRQLDVSLKVICVVQQRTAAGTFRCVAFSSLFIP